MVCADDFERVIIVDLPPLLFDQLLRGLQLIITVQAIYGLIFNLLGAGDCYLIYSRLVIFKDLAAPLMIT